MTSREGNQMENNNYAAEPQETVIEFNRVFRGYNPAEVDSCIESLVADIEALKSEALSLKKKLDAANEEIGRYKSDEKLRKDMLAEAKNEADKIVRDAKSRAAHVIMRTSRQCNRIVGDMVAQVEEQKNIYDATKKEVLRFRSNLFGEYTEHIRKINALVEAAGVFDTDALDEEDINGFITMLHEDNTANEKDGEYDVSEDIRKKIEKIKNDAEHMADEIVAEKTKAQFGDEVPSDFDDEADEDIDRTYVNISSVKKTEESDAPKKQRAKEPDETALNPKEAQNSTEKECGVQPQRTAYTVKDMQEELFEDSPVFNKDNGKTETAEIAGSEESGIDETAASDRHETADEEPDETFKKALEELEAAVSHAENNINEYVDNYGKEAADEDDAGVSVEDVFGSAEKSEDEFEEIWNRNVNEEANSEKESGPSDGSEEDDFYTSGYGFDLPDSAKSDDNFYHEEDDDDDFYHEDDDEFVLGADSDGTPTAASTVSLEVPSNEAENDTPSRWRLKKSMSLTDEFDAIKAENDD